MVRQAHHERDYKLFYALKLPNHVCPDGSTGSLVNAALSSHSRSS